MFYFAGNRTPSGLGCVDAMSMTPLAQGDQRAGTAAPLSPRILTLSLALVLMPFPVILHDFTHRDLSYDYLTLVFPVDLVLAGLIVLSCRPILRDLKARRGATGWGGWLALSAVMTIAWLAHPSQRGVHTLLELYGATAVAHTVCRTTESLERRIILGSVGLVAVGETVWATAQRVTRSNLGLGRLGEAGDPFYHGFGAKVLAPQGSMVHIYVLSGLALVAGAMLAGAALSERDWRRWAIAAGVAIAPVGMTYSRAGLLGFVLLVGATGLVGAPPLRRKSLILVSLLVVGAAIPALIWSDGWRSRASETTSASSSAGLTTQRGRLNHEASTVIKAHPFLGVGPGRYVIALKARFGRETDRSVGIFKPVHDVPILATAEGGILAGGVVVVMLVALAWRALRSGALAVATLLALLPFFLLDHFAYSFPQGAVLTGLWLGTLDRLSSVRQPSKRLTPSGEG
jgi:hypothetical protein